MPSLVGILGERSIKGDAGSEYRRLRRRPRTECRRCQEYSALSGLDSSYLRRRLEQWNQGYHAAAAPPMISIARKLSDDQIEAGGLLSEFRRREDVTACKFRLSYFQIAAIRSGLIVAEPPIKSHNLLVCLCIRNLPVGEDAVACLQRLVFYQCSSGYRCRESHSR